MKPPRLITLALAILLPLLCFAPPPPQKKPNAKPTQTTKPAQTNTRLCPDDNHPHAIDLGLPSGTLWACCNVGADKPEDYGGYYAWGETTTKSTYNWSTYKYCNGGEKSQTKYNTKSDYGTVDNRTQLELSDDAARANWGSPWLMPTLDQLKELIGNCTYTWTDYNGVQGGKFTSKKNGISIFLPAAGCHWNGELDCAGAQGSYWSSSLDTINYHPNYACEFGFNPDHSLNYTFLYGSEHQLYGRVRNQGLSVRPISEP